MATSDSGETLIEALVVVAIAMLVAMVGFPSMSHAFVTLAQRQTASAVAEQLRIARAEALERDSLAVFETAPDGRSFGPADDKAVAAPSSVVVTNEAGSVAHIAFFGDGSSTGGAVLVRTARGAIRVDVARLSGDVSMAAR